ncbi:MAG TPA: TRAP transporter small permease subunit [Croceibacterium sp.]|nr:TRAP transporter small permease subunit [Croceibacterium sp.]
MNALKRIVVWIGGAALLAAMTIDTLAVIGRNIGWPMIGSIELIQAAVLVSGVVGLVFATAHGDHARVRIVLDRLGHGRAVAAAVSRVASVVLFGALLSGSAWLAADLWDGHERSELLGVPWSMLRLIANVGLAACIVIAAVNLFRPGRR